MENFIFCAVRHSKKLKLKLHFGFKLAIWSIQKSIPQSIAYKYSLLMTYSCQNFQLLLFHIILPISFGSRIFFAKKKQSKKLESSNACLWTYQACIAFFFAKTDNSFRIVFSTQSDIYNGAFLPSQIFNTAQKRSFPLRFSSVNATKSADSCGFGHIY